MPVSDISLVTRALRRLFENAITPAPTVTTSRPESVEGAARVLNVYCWHVNEDPHNRFRPQQAANGAIATSPLTLEMHYIITAHTLVNTEFDTLAEQDLLGHAMKALHEVPIFDDNTVAGTEQVFPEAMRGRNNRVEVTMVPMTSTESLTYWANEEEISAKPSAYYVVRPVEIAPDPPTRIPGVVLSVGAFIASMDIPAIGATESDVAYVLPTELGGTPATLTARPAKVGPITVDNTNVLRLRGASFGKGTQQSLLISNGLWSLRFPEHRRIEIDMVANAGNGWSVTLADEVATIEVGEDLAVDLSGIGPLILEMYPGNYLATWQVQDIFDGAAGPQALTQRSNDAAFTITPRITAMVRAGTGEVTLTFGGTWLLNRGRPAGLDPVADAELEILLSVDGTTYELVTVPAGRGSFTITAHTLTYEPLVAANASGLHAVTVVIDGAESQPFWIEIP